MTKEQVRLTPAEAMTYWWLKRIKEFCRGIEERRRRRPITQEEAKFVEIFDSLEPEQWRALYLQLSVKVEEEINRFIEKFSQRTSKMYHETFDKLISEILGVKVPDVDIRADGQTSRVIEANTVWVTEKSLTDAKDYIAVPLTAKPNYILTGDISYLKTNVEKTV